MRLAITSALLVAGVSPALAQPGDVSVTASDSALTVDWTAEGGVTYNLYVATEPGVSVANIGVLAGGRVIESVATPFTLSGLDNNRTYYLVVGEVGGNGAIFESEEAFGTPRGMWTQALPGTVITSVAADPANSGIYLAGGAGEGAGCDGADKVTGCDIFRSTDSGVTWDSVTDSVNQINIQAIDIRGGIGVAASLSADNGAGASPEKLFRSSNGTSWELVLNAVAELTPKIVTIDPNDNTVMYAGNVSLPPAAGQSRILKTNSGGAAWSPLNEIVGGGALRSVDIKVRPGNDQVVWLGGDGNPPLAISNNAGASFTAVTVAGFATVSAIELDPDNPDRMWIAGTIGGQRALLFSSDGGVGFEPRQQGLPTSPITDLTYDEPSGLLFAATGDGVFVSADFGQRFELLGVGLVGPVAAIAHGPSQVIVAATGDGVFRLDLTPPAPVEPPPDAGVDAGGGGGGGGGCCQASAPGRGGLAAALLALLALIAEAGLARRRRAARRPPA